MVTEMQQISLQPHLRDPWDILGHQGSPPTRNHHSTWGVEHRGVLSHGVQPELEAFGSVVLVAS